MGKRWSMRADMIDITVHGPLAPRTGSHQLAWRALPSSAAATKPNVGACIINPILYASWTGARQYLGTVGAAKEGCEDNLKQNRPAWGGAATAKQLPLAVTTCAPHETDDGCVPPASSMASRLNGKQAALHAVTCPRRRTQPRDVMASVGMHMSVGGIRMSVCDALARR